MGFCFSFLDAFSLGLTLFLNLFYRGRTDGYHGDDDGPGVFRLYILCTDFLVDSALGYWGRVGHRGVFDDSEVSFSFAIFLCVRYDV